MRIREIIVERRRNADTNSKPLPISIIKQYYSKSDMLSNNVHNLFISLTSLDKLGINPRSTYATPNGIYCYSGDYVTDNVMYSLDELPFVGDAPYVNIFKVRDPSSIVVLNTVTNDELNTYVDKILAMPEYKKYLNLIRSGNGRVNTPGGQLWYITMVVATAFAQENQKSAPLAWSTLFRKLGINGFVDIEESIIHPHEPSQAVFFSTDAIELLERTPNRISNLDPVLANINYLPDNTRDLKLEKLAVLKPHTALAYAKKVFKSRWPEYNKPNSISAKAEQVIAQDPMAATSYAIELIKGPWPQGEPAIAKHAHTSLKYAVFGLLGRFIKGEEAIRNNQSNSYITAYTEQVINGPWGKGIDGIKDDPSLAISYASKIKGRFPQGEAAIATNAEYAASYAYIIGGRFPQGESAIFSNPSTAFDYVMRYIKQPHPAAEDAIASDPRLSYNYAKYILFGRFIKGEDEINKHEVYNKFYTNEIINGPWGKGKDYIVADPELALLYAKKYKAHGIDVPEVKSIVVLDPKSAFMYALTILNSDDPADSLIPAIRFKDGESIIATSAEYSYRYATEILKGKRFVKGEKVIALDPEFAFKYAKDVIKNPWPPGEDAIASDPNYADQYRNFVSYGYFAKYDKPIIQNLNSVLTYLETLPYGTRYIAGEKMLATTAKSAYTYAMKLNNRFTSGEDAIASDPEYAYLYTKNIINNQQTNTKKRWPPGERAIATSAQWSFTYAQLFHTRFPAGEKAIAKDATYSYLYAILLGEPFPAGEKAIASEPGYANLYDQQFGTNLAQR